MTYGLDLSRITPPDSFTQHRWKCSDTSLPLLDSGVATAANITSLIGTQSTFATTGLFEGGAVQFSNGSGGLFISPDSPGGITGNKLTVSAWIKPSVSTGFGSSWGIFAKNYRASGASWAAPYLTFSLQLDTSAAGTFDGLVTVGGTLFSVNDPGLFIIPGQWNFIALTFDGAAGLLTTYLNGVAGTATGVTVGNLDNGSDGPYTMGGSDVSGSAVNDFVNLRIQEVRVENVVRSAIYLNQVWRLGFGLSPTEPITKFNPIVTTPDSNTIIRYTCDETSLPLFNTGTSAGSGNITTATYGSFNPSVPGRFGNASSLGGITILQSANTPGVGPTGSSLTFSAWVRPTTFGAGTMAGKQALANGATWAQPYTTWLLTEGSTPGTWSFVIAVGGIYYGTTNIGVTGGHPDAFAMRLNEWNFVGATYDGSTGTAILYINGLASPAQIPQSLSAVPCPGGPIDYSADGPYCIGGFFVNGTAASLFVGSVDEIRAESVIRSAAYMRESYLTGAKPLFGTGVVPVINSVNFTLGDVIGGNSIIMTGTGFTNVSAVIFGSTYTSSFVINSPTQITVTVPAVSAGIVGVTVFSTVGFSNSVSYEFFDPTPNATGMWEAPNYNAGTSTWTARVGTNFVASAIIAGIAVPATNGAPHFSDIISPTQCLAGPTTNTLFSQHIPYWLATVVNMDVIQASSDITTGQGIISGNGDWSLTVAIVGGTAYAGVWTDLVDGGRTDCRASVAIPATGRSFIEARIVSNAFQIRVNGGSWVIGTYNDGFDRDQGTLYLGTDAASQSGSNYRLNGIVQAMITSTTIPSDPIETKYVQWAAAMHP